MTNSGVAGWVVACVLAAILFGEAMATRSIFDRYKDQGEKTYRSDYYCSTKPRFIEGKPAAPSNPKGHDGGSEKSEYELCQQWRAAEAAEEAAIVAWIQLPFSVVGIGLVILATVFAAKSARAAIQTVETQVRLEQPLLVVSDIQFAMTKGNRGRIDINIQNVGKTPALILESVAHCWGGERLPPPVADKYIHPASGAATLTPRNEKHTLFAFIAGDMEIEAVFRAEIPIYVWGRLHYEDALGRTRAYVFTYRGMVNRLASLGRIRAAFEWTRAGGSTHNYDREIKSK